MQTPRTSLSCSPPCSFFFTEAWSIDIQETRAAWPIVDQYDRLLGLKRNQARILPPKPPLAETAFPDDPIVWLEQVGRQYLPPVTHRGKVHGDFHADNLFTDGEHLWVVDFERTGIGPIFADFCELEVDLLTRLLPTTVPHAEFCALVGTLLIPSTPAPDDITLSSDAVKMLLFLRELRALAPQLTRCGEMIEYEWGAFFDCLFVMGMKPSALPQREQQIQRERAWLYATALCCKIENMATAQQNRQT